MNETKNKLSGADFVNGVGLSKGGVARSLRKTFTPSCRCTSRSSIVVAE